LLFSNLEGIHVAPAIGQRIQERRRMRSALVSTKCSLPLPNLGSVVVETVVYLQIAGFRSVLFGTMASWVAWTSVRVAINLKLGQAARSSARILTFIGIAHQNLVLEFIYLIRFLRHQGGSR
jgi:hypothetical protein